MIRSGGLPVFWQQMRALPRWFLRWYGTSKYTKRVAYYSFSATAFLRPNWAVGHALLAETLISLGRFDEAFAAWERAFALKPEFWAICARIHQTFIVYGQTRMAQNVMQRYLDAQNDFAREHQLDKLGIRFHSEFLTQIGHIGLLDSYVKMGILGQRSIARPILLINPGLSNPCYLDYWRSYLPDIIADPVTLEILWPLAKYLEDRFNAVMDSSGQQIYEQYTGDMGRTIQAQWENEGREPLLTLSDSDRERGWQCLRDLGVPTDAWFVCLHVREGKTTLQDFRSANIKTYRLAMESIIARGGWVIRMGDPFMPPLPPRSQVIDYVHSRIHSDWMDVFLWASCRFFIVNHSGPAWVPSTFGVPCVVTNWCSQGLLPWFSKDICIFRLNWSEHEARYMNFAEVISSALAWTECTEYRNSQGIKIVENTPEELNDVVIEMLDRLEGNLQYSAEDEDLQKQFTRLYGGRSNKAFSRIGRAFLRKWAHLL